MRKKKILWVNEASFLATGYATYGREVMKRMHETGKYEIAELSCYCNYNDQRAASIPWRVYPNLPRPEEEEIFKRDSHNLFGKWKFESVCIDFKPDYVIDIRDFWMWFFESESPFRRFFRHIIMPTVDSVPQQEIWLNHFAKADRVLTYQDWSYEYLAQFDNINLVGSAPSAGNDVYSPKDKAETKKKIGIPENTKVIGTMMRNQMRKLYPQLFQDFRKFLDQSRRDDIILLCHVSYPDNNGWDIPDLLNEYGLGSKVVFSYICSNCGNIKIDRYEDIHSVCGRCGKDSMVFPSVEIPFNDNAMSDLFNCMDLYVQYSCAEGLGMPQIEAAACGVPVMSVNYSGMKDIVEKTGGYPIDYVLSKELQTGSMRAIPKSFSFISSLVKFFSLSDEERSQKSIETRQKYEENYGSWDRIADVWMKIIDECPMPEYDWGAAPQYKPIITEVPDGMSDTNFVRWLMKNIWKDEFDVNNYMELDLIKKLGLKHEKNKGLNREQVYNTIVNRAMFHNEWEKQRISII